MAVGAAMGWLLGVGVVAQVLPLEFHQELTTYNLQSQRGVPISGTVGNPPGSDGRMPTSNESGSILRPTPGQFQGLVSFGAVPGLTAADQTAVSQSPLLNAGATPFSAAVATEMRLPVGRSGQAIVMILRRAQVGAPYLSRQISFPFGSIVNVPVTDENGITLADVTPEAYWLPEPYTTNNHANAGYYWSPHARKVYAVQAGPLTIRWIKAAYGNTKPSDYDAHPDNYYRDAVSNYFRLYTAHYVVSGSPVKPPRKIYWTERGFRRLGKPVAVPPARVGAVHVVYNNNFPRTVAEEYVGPGTSNPTDGTTNQPLPELRTLWYDQQQGNLYAYNREGRAFVELLGDSRPDGQTREPLGFEIVDVFKEPKPLDVTVELGDRIRPPAGGELESLSPEPILQPGGAPFAYQHSVSGATGAEFYAIRETANLNDYLIHWMEEGEVGLRWPALLGRYHLVWPTDLARYSHYLRSEVATEEEAKATAVPLPTGNVPTIQYQDSLDRPRAKFTETFAFYTFLEPAYPAHRTLLMFTSGDKIAFERVFSWLDTALKSGDFAGDPIVTGLDAWNAGNQTLNWPPGLAAPRYVEATADVGRRLTAPAGEAGATAGDDYLAGYLNPAVGTAFNPSAYVDPFVEGFEVANLGAIIPVNALPGEDHLEVWWFRPNGADVTQGFSTIYWPAVLGRYTLQWPANPREIVLASNLGSAGDEPLTSLEAKGSIYQQNTPGEPGYNPNEEHALLSGGTVFATRDDLNLPTSSAPFVLLDYMAADGRPAMSGFRVLREKPEAGWVFDYPVPAGRLLQPLMPLPLLGKPVEGSGENAINYNTEPSRAGGDLPGGWDAQGANEPYGHYAGFTYRDRNESFWVFRGPHAGLPSLEAGRYDTNTHAFVALSPATAVVGQLFVFHLHASRQAEFLELSSPNRPAWLQVAGLALQGTPETGDVGSSDVTLVLRDAYEGAKATNTLHLEVLANGAVAGQPPLRLWSTNVYTGVSGGTVVAFTNRPPFLAESPTPTNSFTLRYYYRTEPGFAWPGVPNPPPPGSIVPYLLPKDVNGDFVGDPAAKDTPALDIVYRPYWPERDPQDAGRSLPTMPYGLTLTSPQAGLPGVRDWRTARVLYQQSVAADIGQVAPSVVLHDPTREKVSDLAAQSLDQVPASVRMEYFQGRYYFPNLPPHLAQRVFYDPNRGANGSLVLKGEFKDEAFGEDYLLLNVLRGQDLDAVRDLCPSADTANRPKWEALVDALATPMETFHEDPATPGRYLADPNRTVQVGVGELAEVGSDSVAVDSYALSVTGPGGGYVTLVENGGRPFTQPGDPVALHVLRVVPELHTGELKVIPAANPLSELVTFQHTPDLAGRFREYSYEWKIAAPVDGQPPASDPTMPPYQALTSGAGQPLYVLGGAGIRVLGDNYLVLRYKPNNVNHPLYDQWSDWTRPQLAEGWIKRVLAGINPFNQRLRDLFNHRVNTDASILTQAGHRWEGDVALNLDTINNYGLIEIYETVLRRGRGLSIDAGYNYGPANDALLLAAGYLNDLYMMEGNEAWADAANPTIGIGTANNTYGDIATALFAFKGQIASLLDEELALLRGRDDFLVPGVELAPVYNRLVWNYTRGIDAGEVIYALNYNIQEDPDRSPDGVIDATDAARMFPQGHGDAYGHYLTALKGYYSLLINNYFDWVPRSEAVLVLGQPVSVDYQDERKFAAAAAALARAGQQIFNLTWRRDFQAVQQVGWSHFDTTRVNSQREFQDGNQRLESTRYWGLDHWASRVGQADYLNWVVGNAILPAVDPDPTHEGIQKIDRTTVPELQELALAGEDLQNAMDSAEGGLTPLGLPDNAIAFDLNPNRVVGADNGTHFEQIYQRALRALNNALAAFDDAKNVTRLMRSEQNSLADFQNLVAQQELAYENSLIELYGTPYSDDIGPGKTWKQGYTGPDLVHYMYVELPERDFPGLWNYVGETSDFQLDIQDFPSDWATNYSLTDLNLVAWTDPGYTEGRHYLSFNLGPHGFSDKPADWTGRRASPGKLQEAISRVIAAHTALRQALFDQAGSKADLDRSIALFRARLADHQTIRAWQAGLLGAEQALDSVELANDIIDKVLASIKEDIVFASDAIAEALPGSLIVGVASGGDLTSAGRSAIEIAGYATKKTFDTLQIIRFSVVRALQYAVATSRRWVEFSDIAPLEWSGEVRSAIAELGNELETMQALLATINVRLREYDDARRNYRALLAQGDRIQQERLVFRQRASAVVQGYRTRDAGFRIFRNEKLERYKTLFDLAARYAFLAAQAYDYETGLLNTAAGRDFIRRIVSARALGVVRDGQPQFAGSNTGDPGLSSVLAEMKADWDVLRGRLGFNNPDSYGTTVSLRTEAFRILPTSDGDRSWQDVLNAARRKDLLEDADVRDACLQIADRSGLPVPGLILSFRTTIADGYNLFGRPLAAGDHAFSPSSFATKIFAVGVAFEGYRGMDDPAANRTAVAAAGGVSPADPSFPFLDPQALSATPYVYLIPVGVDSLRVPPLGDASDIRTWRVADVAIPMPFNIGASDFSAQPLWLSGDSLAEPLFAVRKHQAFRPVSSAAWFSPNLYSSAGTLLRSQFTNNRLVGRSVWNSEWKLIIPGRTLLNDPNEGLDRFIQTVKDIKLHFVTYSYSGN